MRTATALPSISPVLPAAALLATMLLGACADITHRAHADAVPAADYYGTLEPFASEAVYFATKLPGPVRFAVFRDGSKSTGLRLRLPVR